MFPKNRHSDDRINFEIELPPTEKNQTKQNMYKT